MDPELQQTFDLIKGVISSTPMNNAVSPDVAKAFNLALNLVPYNLEHGAKLLFPVMSPIRNQIPRRKGYGKATQFKAITGIDTTGSVSTLFALEGTKGNTVTTQETDVTIGYVSMGKGDQVTLEADIQGQGQVDARAIATANLLRAFMISEEQAILGAQGPTGQATSAGGGSVTIGGQIGNSAACTMTHAATSSSLGAGTYQAYQVAHTYMGNALPQSAATSVVASAGDTLTITPVATAGQPVLSYDIYYKLSTDTNYVKVSTNGKPVLVASYSAGSATNSGAYTAAVNGALAKSNIDTMLRSMWDNSRANPDQMWLNSFEAQTITNLTLTTGAPYFLTVDKQEGATVNFRAERYVNPVTGNRVKVDVHPYINQGTVLVLSSQMPAWYPASDIPSVWTMDLPLDYTQLSEDDWAA
jgi:hypothetical protein